ncbi:DEAD/DEAH box helicase [Desulfovibrio desulfuricans]|uniref:DEAD/DEAH box helicase n=1 Tax=Desulfovibrio desulfuricans TaxID=876 RepID=UPI001F38D53D|nr:DEAD/DEAH box helicase [Desulfovibrio desulfuricans]UIB00763.1 DEAD/DEAH box helicase [Desulfovibrio desulfuricans]
MFDNITRSIIEKATPLSGIKMNRLPQELTAAYAKIVSFRVASHDSKSLKDEIKKIEQIGKTYLAILLSHRDEHFQSIAFVSASAYSLVGLYHGELGANVFDRNSVCPQCASILLYIIADAISDAAEVAARISDIEDTHSAHDHISQLIRNLALGKLSKITQATEPLPFEGNPDAQATTILYEKCIQSVQELCRCLLGNDDGSFDGALQALLNIKQFSVENISYEFKDSPLGHSIYSTFPGPFILSSLLNIAAERLIKHSLISVAPPDPQHAALWNGHIKRLCRTRPYLWPNHARAIYDNDVLKPGISAIFSLPTGAGKTTLSNLKIVSTLVSGGKVVFLAPTHALVQQVSDELRETFPVHTVKNAILDGEYVETEEPVLADIAVMTPERCLAFLMFYPAAFAQVHLVIFDECHILHASDWAHSYRASDSMMCLHRLFEHAPQADYFLLSAMIANTEDLAGWLEERTGRPCIPVQDEWKPTRQVKGCIVYQKTDLTPIEQGLKEDHGQAVQTGRKSPGVEIQRALGIQPWVFFGLNQTWNSSKVIDYLALPISAKKTMLATNKFWTLSPNKNEVASSLARTLLEAGMKTLVFAQQIDHTQSIAADISSYFNNDIKLTEIEHALISKIEDELGSLSISYIRRDNIAACHHGLLLKEERELVESMFRRPDGIGALAATPTLAQGMNLPAEAVILAGDERWSGNNGQEKLEAHELLNAAGRAGRAGYSAKGLVLVIPNKVVSLEYSNDGGASIGSEWIDLKNRTFSKSDQCLQIVDPIAKLLDAVQDGSISGETAAHYLFRRMPFRDGLTDIDNIKKTLNSSLAAFIAKKNATLEAFRITTEATVEASREIRNFDVAINTPWKVALATELGVDLNIVETATAMLNGLDPTYSVYQYLDWAKDSGLLTLFARPSSHAEIVSALTTKQERDQENHHHIAYARLVNGLKAWCGGATLLELSEYVLETPKTRSHCKNSRKLAIRWAPEVAYSLGSVARMYKYKCEEEKIKMPLCLATLASLIRIGLDSAEKLALLHIREHQLTRRRTHQLYQEIADGIPLIDTYASFRDVLKAVNDAYARHTADKFRRPKF